MQRRHWGARTTVLDMLEGLKGKSVAEICTEDQTALSQCYQWRVLF
jgi:hypothetical protein